MKRAQQSPNMNGQFSRGVDAYSYAGPCWHCGARMYVEPNRRRGFKPDTRSAAIYLDGVLLRPMLNDDGSPFFRAADGSASPVGRGGVLCKCSSCSMTEIQPLDEWGITYSLRGGES